MRCRRCSGWAGRTVLWACLRAADAVRRNHWGSSQGFSRFSGFARFWFEDHHPVKITVLGSGTSSGVPFIGCECAVCQSTDPRDKRTRPSILIDLEQASPEPRRCEPVRFVLVDTSTDLRAQALANDVRRVDAILFTHAHADHVCGFDDIRRFNAICSRCR